MPKNGNLIKIPDTFSTVQVKKGIFQVMLGSGASSASQGGSSLQWRGMAPKAHVWSYVIPPSMNSSKRKLSKWEGFQLF